MHGRSETPGGVIRLPGGSFPVVEKESREVAIVSLRDRSIRNEADFSSALAVEAKCYAANSSR